MTGSPNRLAEKLLAEGEKTYAFFRSLSEADWGKVVYTEGAAWTVRQVLAHFMITEAAFIKLIENIAAGGSGSPEDFDIDRYNVRKVAAVQDQTAAELLQAYASLRKKMAEIVANLAESQLASTGRHPFLGVAPLGEIIKLAYRHNQIHLRDVRRLVGDQPETL